MKKPLLLHRVACVYSKTSDGVIFETHHNWQFNKPSLSVLLSNKTGL